MCVLLSVEKKTIMPLQDIAVLQTVIYRSGYSKVRGSVCRESSAIFLGYASFPCFACCQEVCLSEFDLPASSSASFREDWV